MSEGVVIDQRFRLGRVIRESGVAVVYEAKHRNGAEAWIKLPRGPEHAQALATEARVANALGKNAVNVRDDGVTDEGVPYLVQEPVTGQRLDHWREFSGGRAPPEEAMGLGDELCHAIGTMHQAGFAVGLLRADAIIVLPKGGMCLLELEHARPATPATVKEDVVRVGRVLYEMLAGMPCLAQGRPLHEAVPELPRAMTTTVDDAARGRFSTIEELRGALRSAMPEWLGPMRRPMPSVVPEEVPSGDFDFDEIVLPRSSKSLFDPRDLVDSSRGADIAQLNRPSTPGSPMRLSTPGSPMRLSTPGSPMRLSTPGSPMRLSTPGSPMGPSTPGSPMRPSHPGRPSSPSHSGRPSDLEAPPVAAFERIEQERPAKRGSVGLIVAGASAFAITLATIALVVFAFSKDEVEPRAPAAKAATSAVAPFNASPPAALPSAVLPASSTTEASGSGDVIEVDDLAGKPSVDASLAANVTSDAAAVVAAAGETTFRFEGSLSPRLVIVDGIIVGATTKEVRVSCGAHSVKIGGKGVARSIDLPCGGEQGIVIEPNGTWRTQ